MILNDQESGVRNGHIRLLTHPGNNGPKPLPIHWGAATPEARGPLIATLTNSVAPQRDRRALGLVRHLSRARGRLRRARPGAPGRPHQHHAHRRRSVRTPAGPTPSASSRIDPYGHMVGEVFADELRAGLQHPAHDRGHHGAHRSAGDSRRDRRGPAQARRQGAARARRLRGHQGRASSPPGTCPASPSASASTRPSCATRCSKRPRACTRSSSRAATSRCSCRRSAGRRSTCSATSARSRDSERAAHRARARRVQRLGRVRLGHLHLPSVSHARHRGVHSLGAGRRHGPDRLLAQGGPRARRGDQVPRLQRAQASGGRRPRRRVLRTHRVRRGRAGRALPGADARRAALARHPPHPSLRLDEQREVRRHHRAPASPSARA